MRLREGQALSSLVIDSSVIHIFGAGLNQERPAHTAAKELSDRGWAIAPIHPKDGGATIDGFPIRPELDQGVIPEIVVFPLRSGASAARVKKVSDISLKSKCFPSSFVCASVYAPSLVKSA